MADQWAVLIQNFTDDVQWWVGPFYSSEKAKEAIDTVEYTNDIREALVMSPALLYTARKSGMRVDNTLTRMPKYASDIETIVREMEDARG